MLDSKGDVVTNWHVVESGGSLRVTDSHGTMFGASTKPGGAHTGVRVTLGSYP